MSPQGKKGNPAAAARKTASPPPRSRKTLGLIIFGVLFVALFVVCAAAIGLGQPSVPDGAIAVVEDAPNGTITKEEFDRALVQAAARQGLKDVPATDDPQYQLLADSAEGDLILSRWVLGEAEDRGIEITERQIDDELNTIKQQQFGCQPDEDPCEAFDKFLDQSGFDLDEARNRIKLQLISDEIQKAVLPQTPEVTDDEVQTYYDANLAQFEQPETRDVRVIITKTEDEANQALAALGDNPSPSTWEKVAKKYSIDEATQATGGLRPAVVAGQSEKALDEQIFSADENVLVGPFKGDAGYYVIDVEKITPAATQQLDDPVQAASAQGAAQTVADQIRATLVSAHQQQIAQDFQTDFQNKWVARTFCAEGFRIERCANADPPPDPCTKDVAESQGCDAPVASTRPIAPGTNTVFGSTPATSLPQGPLTPAPPAAAGTPPGLTPVPGGAAPPTAPPQTPPPAPAPPGG